jgi:hypothetical protein
MKRINIFFFFSFSLKREVRSNLGYFKLGFRLHLGLVER